MRQEIKRDCLSVDECQSKSGMSAWWWRRQAYSGRVISIKISRRLMIPTSEVDRIISENTRPRIAEVSAA
jgi:hypothetical protein